MRAGRLLVAGVLLLGALPAHSRPDPGPAGIRAERSAFAMFTFSEGRDRFPFVAAFVFGYAQDGGPERLFGGFVQGACERDRGKGWVSVGCRGREGVGGRLREGEFQMDPAAQTASLRLRRHDETYALDWTADGRPGWYQSSEWCYTAGSEEPDGEGHGGGLYQEAVAEGRAFDRRLESSGRWVDGAVMERGGMLSQCSWLSAADVEALRSGDFARVTFGFRRPG